MYNSDALFLLIKAMSKSEKRYFKVENVKSESNSSKDYLRLFDAIDAQKEYDEKALKKKFKGERYFNQIGAVKHYLYRQIQKSLTNYYHESSPNIRLNESLSEIEILFNKNLINNCANSIKKAKALAYKHEKWPELLRLVSWETKVTVLLYSSEKAASLNQEIEVERTTIWTKYQQQIALQVLGTQIRLFFRKKGYAKTPEERKHIENILSNELLGKPAHSSEGEINRLVMRANCYTILGKQEERFNESKKGIEYFQSHPDMVQANFLVYFHNLRDLADIAIAQKKFTYAESLATILNDLHKQYQHKLNLKSKIVYLDFEASILLYKGEFEKALEIIPKTRSILEQFDKTLEPIDALFLHFINFHIHFRNKDFRNTQLSIQEIINLGQIRWDMQALVRIANLIVQYEQHEYQHLGYVWRSTYRYLLKKEMLEKPETVILNFIKNISRINSEKQALNSLIQLREEFLPYKDESFIASFPLIEWIDSKLQKREISEIVMENYLKAKAAENG
ncbi:MAG: hypothetical protein IPP77_15130 [Bacteroidetes bacterium]|nr:hypothetical protein [Bacteroidota bacterium]